MDVQALEHKPEAWSIQFILWWLPKHSFPTRIFITDSMSSVQIQDWTLTFELESHILLKDWREWRNGQIYTDQKKKYDNSS